MNRATIEKIIVKNLESPLAQYGFSKIEEKYRNENYCIFLKEGVDLEYHFKLTFLRYGEVNPYFGISSKKVTELYNLFNEDKKKYYKIFNPNIRVLLNPKNANGYLQSYRQVEPVHRELIQAGEELEMVSKSIFETYFLHVVPDLTSKFDNLTYIDKVINDKPVQIDTDGRPLFLVYSPNFIHQILSGVLVGNVVQRENFKEVVQEYEEFLQIFKVGEREDIDFIRLVISKLSNE